MSISTRWKRHIKEPEVYLTKVALNYISTSPFANEKLQISLQNEWILDTLPSWTFFFTSSFVVSCSPFLFSSLCLRFNLLPSLWEKLSSVASSFSTFKVSGDTASKQSSYLFSLPKTFTQLWLIAVIIKIRLRFQSTLHVTSRKHSIIASSTLFFPHSHSVHPSLTSGFLRPSILPSPPSTVFLSLLHFFSRLILYLPLFVRIRLPAIHHIN